MTKMQQLQVREPRWRLWFRLYCSVKASSSVLWQPAESKESLHCSRPPHEPLCGIGVGSASWKTLNDHLRWRRQGELVPGRGMIQVQALMTGNSWMMLPLCPLLGWHQTPFTQSKRERDGALRGLHFFFLKDQIPNITAFTATATWNWCFSSQKKIWVFLWRKGQKIKAHFGIFNVFPSSSHLAYLFSCPSPSLSSSSPQPVDARTLAV